MCSLASTSTSCHLYSLWGWDVGNRHQNLVSVSKNHFWHQCFPSWYTVPLTCFFVTTMRKVTNTTCTLIILEERMRICTFKQNLNVWHQRVPSGNLFSPDSQSLREKSGGQMTVLPSAGCWELHLNFCSEERKSCHHGDITSCKLILICIFYFMNAVV